MKALVAIDELRKSGRSGTPGVAKRRIPSWFKVRIQQGSDYLKIRNIVNQRGLHTICEEARCPNIWECWNNRTATFLILGDICTRRCHYCAVKTGRPEGLDIRGTSQNSRCGPDLDFAPCSDYLS